MPSLITPSFQPADSVDELRQTVTWTGTQTVHKVSLDMTIVNAKVQNFIVGNKGTISFAAANFREGRDTWVFRPSVHSLGFPSLGLPAWDTIGRTLWNVYQTEAYISPGDAAANAPYVSYDIFFDLPGVYELWGRGTTLGRNIYWSFDDDTSDMRKTTIGTPYNLEWNRFGVFFTETGGVHTFRVYLGDGAATTFLDQWYFTIERNFDEIISSSSLEAKPIPPLSKSPFNTFLRIEGAGGDTATSWLSSKEITASGRYSHRIQSTTSPGINYINSAFIHVGRIGGSSEHFPAWDYQPQDEAGDAAVSNDYGVTFTDL